MAIKCVLLDLDQTLAMPEQGYKFQDEILKGYTKVLSELLKIPIEKVVEVVLDVVEEVKREPQEKYTIAERLFSGFAKKLGVTIIEMLEATDYYYFNEFTKLKKHYKATTGAYEVTKELADEGYQLAIATDPLIRLFGVVMRIKWIGLEKIPFCFISSADTSHAAKPHPLFYKEIVEKCFCKPNEAVMVGDLIENDIVGAKKAGLKTILFMHDLNKDLNKRSTIKPDAIIYSLYELPSTIKKL